ncbi:MAG: helix-turn-helix domain-containing protein [Chthoniobacteraceae bacterium]
MAKNIPPAPYTIARSSRRSGAPELIKTESVNLETFPISGAIVPNHPEFPEHWHRFIEIVLVVKGTAIHVINGHGIPIFSGHVFVMPPSFKHALLQTNDLRVIVVCYNPAEMDLQERDLDDLPGYRALFQVEPRLRSAGVGNHILQLSKADLSRVEAIADTVVQESCNRPAGFRVMAKARLLQFIVELARLYHAKPSSPKREATRLAGALRYIEDNLAEPIDIDSLCRRLHFSKRSFYRLFKAVTGDSPLNYLRSCRLNEAARMFRESEKTISEIAFAVGFQDPSHFSRSFHKRFGTSPSEYRL